MTKVERGNKAAATTWVASAPTGKEKAAKMGLLGLSLSAVVLFLGGIATHWLVYRQQQEGVGLLGWPPAFFYEDQFASTAAKIYSTGVWMSVVPVAVFIFAESRRFEIPHWKALLVGTPFLVACTFPLFLRELIGAKPSNAVVEKRRFKSKQPNRGPFFLILLYGLTIVWFFIPTFYAIVRHFSAVPQPPTVEQLVEQGALEEEAEERVKELTEQTEMALRYSGLAGLVTGTLINYATITMVAQYIILTLSATLWFVYEEGALSGTVYSLPLLLMVPVVLPAYLIDRERELEKNQDPSTKKKKQ